MIAIVTAWILAAGPALGDGLAWIPDSELEVRAATARAESKKFEAKAQETATLRTTIDAQRKQELEEKDALEASLGTLKGTKKTLAESRIKELTANLAMRDKRLAELAREFGQYSGNAKSQASYAAQIDAERAKREREAEAALKAEEEERLTEIPSARLTEAKAHHGKQKARFATQIAALDKMMSRSNDAGVNASLVARKNEVRTLSASNDVTIQRLSEELRERAAAKDDEAERLAELERAAKARATAEAPDVESEADKKAHSESIDRVLDALIAKEDAIKARSAARRKRASTALRISILGVVLFGGIAAVWYAVKRK